MPNSPNRPIFQYTPPPSRPTFTYIPAPAPRFQYQPAQTQADGTLPHSPQFLQKLLNLLNRDRAQAALPPVSLHPLASQIAHRHTQEMAQHHYFSHWDLQGYGPDMRYGLQGGTELVMENLSYSAYSYTNGHPSPISDWQEVVETMQDGLMNSPGHRVNILDPFHTHVGLAFTHDPATSECYMAQEFINHYILWKKLPTRVVGGDSLELKGQMLPAASAPMINIATQPPPKPLSTYDLNHTMPKSYRSEAKFHQVIHPTILGSELTVTLAVPRFQLPTFYHIRTWVQVKKQEVLASELIFLVSPC